jgi:hypothetical protein
MEGTHGLQVHSQWFNRRDGQHGHLVFISFSIAHDDLLQHDEAALDDRPREADDWCEGSMKKLGGASSLPMNLLLRVFRFEVSLGIAGRVGI